MGRRPGRAASASSTASGGATSTRRTGAPSRGRSATDSVTWVDEAPDGTIWVAQRARVSVRGTVTVGRASAVRVDRFARGRPGRARVGDAAARRVQVWNGTSWLPLANPPTVDNYEITVDVHGVVWMATAIGLMRYDGTSWKTFNAAHGLPSSKVWSVLPDPSGDGSGWGPRPGWRASRARRRRTCTRRPTACRPTWSSRSRSHRTGIFWVGTWQGEHAPYEGGVGHFDGDSWTSYTRENSPLPHNQVQSITVGLTAASGSAWPARAWPSSPRGRRTGAG